MTEKRTTVSSTPSITTIVKLQTKEHHITSNYAFKALKKTLEPWTVHTQKILFLGNYALYLTKPPRVYQGTNNSEIKLQLLQTRAAKNTASQTSTSASGTSQDLKKKPKLYQDIEKLLTLMNRYNASDKNQLIANVHNSTQQEDKDTLTDLIRAMNWNLIYKRSQEEFVHKVIIPTQSNYYTLFQQYISKEPSDFPQLSIIKTADFLEQWTREQNIPLGTLMLELYATLRMFHPKKNCFYMQGESNAGKTYLFNMILPQKDKVGSHITEFPFQECTKKSVILINELTLANQQEAELYKNILGGEAMYVNVKGKPAELLERKPVFLTSNEAIYRFISNEKIPLLNRMYHHMNLSSSKIINRFTPEGIPSPGYAHVVFQNIEDLLTQLRIPGDENFLDHSQQILENLTDDLLGIKTATSIPDRVKTFFQALITPPAETTQTTTSTQETGTQTDPMEVDLPPKPETRTQETQTDPPPPPPATAYGSTPPIVAVEPFPKQQDAIENPHSTVNIDQQARLSPLQIDTSNQFDEDSSDFEPIVINFNHSPPRSPSPQPTPSPQDTPSRNNLITLPRPTGLLPENQQTITFRRNDDDPNPTLIRLHSTTRRENPPPTPARPARRPRRRSTPYRPITNTWLTTRRNRRQSDSDSDDLFADL